MYGDNLGRVAITGLGLVTSLGLTASSTLAAVMSGIANFTEHETVLVNANHSGTELTGAKIARLPSHTIRRELHGADRALALLAPAIQECIGLLPQGVLEKSHCRFNSGIEPHNLKPLLTNHLQDLRIEAVIEDGAEFTHLGRCQFVKNIINAVEDLRAGKAPIVLVGAVDSLCDDGVLQQLADTDRLKSGTYTEGFIAGEAAGVFLLELESHARRREANILGYIRSWGQNCEPHPWTIGAPSIAAGLTNAFQDALTNLPAKGDEIDVVLADLNGERARANEWALTKGRTFPRTAKVRELKHPADCTGDCGAAMGTILLATAIGLLSGASPLSNAALSVSDEQGARGILCFEKGTESGVELLAQEKQKQAVTTVSAVIDQHMDDASFLWLRRQGLVKDRHIFLRDLQQHDLRIQANLIGLGCAGESGWKQCERRLETGDAGDYFVAAAVAFKSLDKGRIATVLNNAGTEMDHYKAISSALGWLPLQEAEPHIKRLLDSEPPLHRYVGIAASSIHRHDPAHHLEYAAFDTSSVLKARALLAYGELGRRSIVDLCTLQSYFTDEDNEIRFAAAWSAALAGDSEAVEVLMNFGRQASPFTEKALETAFRVTGHKAALSWHADLAAHLDTTRSAAIGAGIIGDTVLIRWLLEQMLDPTVARIAGDAFSMMTGLDFASSDMEATPTEGYAGGRDKDLPWPNVTLLRAWWSNNKSRYPAGCRYLFGHPITQEHLEHVLKTGCQRYRAAAALELAIMKGDKPLFEVRAPGFSQG